MRLLGSLLLMLVLVVLLLGGYWAFLTQTIDAPYHEVWIGLNSPLPEPLRAWSCGAVEARLGPAAVPPYGCEGLWGRAGG